MAAATMLISGLAAGGVVLVVANAVQRADGLAASLATPSARSVTLTASDPKHSPIPFNVSQAIAGLPAVTNAVALGAPASVHNTSLPGSTTSAGMFSLRTLTGPDPYTIDTGRAPAPGEVLLSKHAAQVLGIDQPAIGRLTTDDGTILATVGRYTTHRLGAITDLLDTTAVTPTPFEQAAPVADPAAIVVLLVNDPADVGPVVSTITSFLNYMPPGSYELKYDQRAAAVDQTIRDAGRNNVRALALALLAGGSLAAALSAFVGTLTRRRDLARQRALGRTRLDITLTTVIYTATLAAVGALIGVAAVATYLHSNHVHWTPGLLANTVLIATIAEALATLPAASFAAFQDPASILRVP